MSMTSHASRGIIERYVEVARTGDTSRLGEIIAPEFRIRLAAPVGVEGIASGLRAIHAGFTEITSLCIRSRARRLVMPEGAARAVP